MAKMCLSADEKKAVTSSQQVMQKDLNRQEKSDPELSLPRSKVLRGKKNFQRLFEKSTVLSTDSLHFRYRLYQNPEEGCLIGFIAPKKKNKSAVQRNRVKRIMREAYRLNQGYLQDIFAQKKLGFHGAFIANSPDLNFSKTESDTVTILKDVRERLLNALPTEHDDAGRIRKTSTTDTKKI